MQGERTTERTVKIELLSQWTLEAEFRKNIVFVWNNAECLSDHAQLWPKQHIQGKNIVFPISQIYPYSCYHVLILSVCDVRVYILMSAVVANRVGAPGEQLQQLIRWFLLPHPLTHWETLTHSLRGNFVKSVQMSGLEDLGPLPEGWSLKWHGVGNTRRPWVMKYCVL